MATRTYQANTSPVINWWKIRLFRDGVDQGEIFRVSENDNNPNLIVITPASGKSIRITKEHAVVLAEDLLARYAAEVGAIVREP